MTALRIPGGIVVLAGLAGRVGLDLGRRVLVRLSRRADVPPWLAAGAVPGQLQAQPVWTPGIGPIPAGALYPQPGTGATLGHRSWPDFLAGKSADERPADEEPTDQNPTDEKPTDERPAVG